MPTKTQYQRIHREACAAGDKAYEAVHADKYIAVQHANPLDDNSPITKAWTDDPFELFGFAWVVLPGNTGFGRWLIKTGNGTKHYGGGVGPWVRRGTGYDRKVAWATAYAQHINEAGILPEGKTAYGTGRLD